MQYIVLFKYEYNLHVSDYQRYNFILKKVNNLNRHNTNTKYLTPITYYLSPYFLTVRFSSRIIGEWVSQSGL